MYFIAAITLCRATRSPTSRVDDCSAFARAHQTFDRSAMVGGNDVFR